MDPKPVLADEFCLYEDEEAIHIPYVTIYDPDLGCIFNLTLDQALELYPEAMEDYTLLQETKKIFHKSTSIYSPNDHNNLLIIDSGADTSGIGGTEWIIDEITERSVNISGYNNHIYDKKSKIGSAITAVDLPDDTTILVKINEATLLGEEGNSLLSTTQAEYYGTIVNNFPRSRGGTIPIFRRTMLLSP